MTHCPYFSQPAVEGAAGQAQRPGRLADVARRSGPWPCGRGGPRPLRGSSPRGAARRLRRRSPRSAARMRVAGRHQHGALDGVVELAHVARPGMGEQRLQRLRLEAGAGSCGSAARAPRGSAGRAAECPRAARAAAGRGSRPCSGGRAGPGGSGRRRPRRARSALVAEIRRTSDAARPRGADALELAGLQHAQELAPAGVGGTLPISSRKSVPPSASSKRPTRSARASVNAPLHVAEELALEDALGDAAGVDRHEGLARARRGRVERARDDALAACRSRR